MQKREVVVVNNQAVDVVTTYTVRFNLPELRAELFDLINTSPKPAVAPSNADDALLNAVAMYNERLTSSTTEHQARIDYTREMLREFESAISGAGLDSGL